MSLRRAVFLDRDGVLNAAIVRDGKPFSPATLADFEIIPEAPDCLMRLRRAGYLLIVVTNQPDIARGFQTWKNLDEMHEYLRSRMPVDAVYVCAHDSTDHCDCRKPKPGMLLKAAAEWDINLADSFMVGDRWRDMDAGASAGCRTVFLDFSYVDGEPAQAPSAVVQNLPEAVDWILSKSATAGDTPGE